MLKKLLFLLIPFTFLFSDAIEVEPSTLDFGDVLMGNTPTLSFTITAELEQTITITPPSFYSTDITEIYMTEGQTQEVNVTFSPPNIGNWNSQVTLIGDIFGQASVDVYANAVNDLSGSISGVITADYSPYEISGDITIEEGESLVIEPGVTLLFNQGTKFLINGNLSAVGTPDQLIQFIPNNESVWNGLFIESDNNLLQYLIVKGSKNEDLFFQDLVTSQEEFYENYNIPHNNVFITS